MKLEEIAEELREMMKRATIQQKTILKLPMIYS
jgi:hypothetical protein